MQGITEFTFWGYCAEQKLDIPQVPYRDINVAPVDLGEDRIQVVMSSYAIVQPQIQAGRIKALIVNGKTRAPAVPDLQPRARSGYPSLEVEELVGLFGLKTMSDALKRQDRGGFPRRRGRRQHRRAAQGDRGRPSASAGRRSLQLPSKSSAPTSPKL